MIAQAKYPVQVITCREKNEKTGVVEELISHGVDLGTGRTVVLEQVFVGRVNYLRRDPDLGWVLKEN